MSEDLTTERPEDVGLMPLTDHLRELRKRIFRSMLAIVIGGVAGWFLYDWTFEVIAAPFQAVVAEAQAQGRQVQLALTGVADPFVLRMKVAGVTGVVLASPIWLYQTWRFVTPGLRRHERKWSLLFVAVATPLFISGGLLAYLFLPNALGFLFDFTPESVANIVDVSRYVSFFLRTVITFGIGFLLPLFALMLNLAGVLPASALIKSWRWVLLGVFVFAAVATPDGNPLTMTVMALPIMLMIVIVMAIAWVHDRRKRSGDEFADLADDEPSRLDPDLLEPGSE